MEDRRWRVHEFGGVLPWLSRLLLRKDVDAAARWLEQLDAFGTRQPRSRENFVRGRWPNFEDGRVEIKGKVWSTDPSHRDVDKLAEVLDAMDLIDEMTLDKRKRQGHAAFQQQR
ncbi:uncharacterized protein LOC134533348 [Bacillus rossius redtenbacheri]|uniref:uncharacterized protein LOC134533348 n=1 Tax=Bacillus rossius redtenbacheri TaxID=93214 RepID=UPI002FDEEFCB